VTDTYTRDEYDAMNSGGAGDHIRMKATLDQTLALHARDEQMRREGAKAERERIYNFMLHMDGAAPEIAAAILARMEGK
jgi:hypothetical protein